MISGSRIVSIVAGGWSFEAVNHSKVPGTVIGVNDTLIAWRGAKDLDAVVSMDRLWTEHRWPLIIERKLPTYLRVSSLKRIPYGDHDWLHPYECSTTNLAFSTDKKVLNGRSSGATAVNLAYTMKPNILYLFGFDMGLGPRGVAHWYQPYPWTKGIKGNTGAKTYQNWVHDFELYKQFFDTIGTKVYNVSPQSSIRTFQRVSAADIGCGK